MLQRISLLAVLCVLFAGAVAAQQSGQIVGVVHDASGGVVPGAAVRATEVGTGFSRTALAGSDGQYFLPNLRPTQYELTAEAQGFRTFRRAGVELLASQSLTVNISLEVGAVTETITVAGAAVQVNTSTSTLSEVVDRSRIVELPLNGRDAAKLSTLVAGTAIISVSTETGKSIPGGVQFSSNGSRSGQVAWKLDGSSNTDVYFQENQTFPFPDALQEFSIQTSNYAASTGANSGAMVNVVTRSGTNEFHGGAFEFVRNRAFNARSFFASDRDFLKRNQFGAYGGGPIRLPGYDGRNKTFFFLGWQGTRIRNRANQQTAFAPTFDERRGDFSTCGVTGGCLNRDGSLKAIRDPLGGTFLNNQIPVNRFDPAAVNVNSHIPGVGGDGFTVIPKPIHHQLDQGILKVDHQLTDQDRLSGRYFIDHFDNTGAYDPTNLLSYRSVLASRVRSQSAVLTWVRTFSPSVLNDFHFGFNRIHASRGPYFEGVPSMQQLGVRLPIYPTLPSISEIAASGFFSIGDNLEAKFPRTLFEWSNRTSWVRGRHSIQFGGEVTRVRADIVNEFRRAGHFVFNGNVSGFAMADFFLGRIGTFDQGTGEYKANRATFPALFFQDDWKVRPRLTLNLGIRYEPEPPMHEERGRIQQFSIPGYLAGVRSPQFRNAPAGELFRGDPGAFEDGTQPDNNNVGGRVGFAWDVFGDGKTSVRGGAGMFYDQHQQGDFNNGSVNAPPWSIRLSLVQPQGPFSDPYLGRNDFGSVKVENIGRPDAPFPRPVLVQTYDERAETPLTYNWNLTIEREIFPEWLARAAYVGSASNYLRSSVDLNPARYLPGNNSAGQPLSTTGNTDTRRILAPEYGSVSMFVQDLRSSYHSLQTSVTKRFTRGYTVLANYTFSKVMDSYSHFGPFYLPGLGTMGHGPADFDHKHRFVVSYVWDLPNAPTGNAAVRKLLHGWQASGIGQYQTGSPLTINSGRDNSLTNTDDRAKLTSVSREAPAGADKRVWFNAAAFVGNDIGTFGTVGKGSFYGPPLFSWDMGIFKNTRITERINTQFRAEFFNIFNQVNFSNPVSTVSSGGFGTITSVSSSAGEPRIIQFGLKVSF